MNLSDLYLPQLKLLLELPLNVVHAPVDRRLVLPAVRPEILVGACGEKRGGETGVGEGILMFFMS